MSNNISDIELYEYLFEYKNNMLNIDTDMYHIQRFDNIWVSDGKISGNLSYLSKEPEYRKMEVDKKISADEFLNLKINLLIVANFDIDESDFKSFRRMKKINKIISLV